jgi:hypothetical protein
MDRWMLPAQSTGSFFSGLISFYDEDMETFSASMTCTHSTKIFIRRNCEFACNISGTSVCRNHTFGDYADQFFLDKHKEGYPMILAGVACLKWKLLITVPPRAGMIAISYAQTFLINDAINYLETPRQLRDVRHAYGLIGAAAIIYTGTAVISTPASYKETVKSNNTNIYQVLQANYLYKVFRMITTFRGSTASLIYGRALSSDANHNQMAAITLMSTDVDRIGMKLFSQRCRFAH